MIQSCFIFLLTFLSTSLCLQKSYFNYSGTSNIFGNTKGNLLNYTYLIKKHPRHRIQSTYYKIPLFINKPRYTFTKFKNLDSLFSSNDIEQTGLSNLNEDSKFTYSSTAETSDKIKHPSQSIILSADRQPDFSKTKITTAFVPKEAFKEETTPISNASHKLFKSTSLEKSVSNFLTKFDIKNKIKNLKNDFKTIKEAITLFLYPRGASDEVVKYTNLKILERLSLSLSSAIALNVKPLSFTDNLNQTEQSNFIKNKLNGYKMSTIVLTIIFKDVFSRILNYYWFNKVTRLSDNPKFYRLVSTFGYSLVTLWDFFINLMTVEPKTVLLAVNHVIKQLFLGSHNFLNQLYYNTKSETYQRNESKEESFERSNKYKNEEFINRENQTNQFSQLHESNQKAEDSKPENDKMLKPETLNQFKDESNFVFDLMGMAMGTYTSYLLNTHNSDNVKLLSILASLVTTNLLTAYVTTVVAK